MSNPSYTIVDSYYTPSAPDLQTPKKKRTRRHPRPRGFTLAELLIVVAILAVLVSVALPLFTNALDRARKVKDLANVRTVKSLAVAAILTNDIEPDNGWYVFAAIDPQGNIVDFRVHAMGVPDVFLKDGVFIETYDDLTYYILHLLPTDLAESAISP